MDDSRVGRIARVLRQRLGLRQADVADRAGFSREPITRVERGAIDGLTIRSLRRIFRVFDAEVVVLIRWRGGELDRVVDRRHAALGGQIMAFLEGRAWGMSPEVSFSEYGERGSIDVLAWHSTSRCLLVVEVKTELTSIEETIRRHDVKTRLAAKIARERYRWDAQTVSRLLVLPDDRTARRHVERHDAILRRAYPDRGWAVRRWLGAPGGSLAGIWFLPDAGGTDGSHRTAPRVRVRRPSSRGSRQEVRS